MYHLLPSIYIYIYIYIDGCYHDQSDICFVRFIQNVISTVTDLVVDVEPFWVMVHLLCL